MKKNNSSITLKVQHQKAMNESNLNSTSMTQSFAKLLSFQSPKPFQRKPSQRVLDNKKCLQKKDSQKRICFISPQKSQFFKKVNQRNIDFNTLTYKQNNSMLSDNSSKIQSSVQSKKTNNKKTKQSLIIDLDSNSSFFQQIQNLNSSYQNQSQKSISRTSQTNKPVNIVKKSVNNLNKSTICSTQKNKEHYTNRNQENLLTKTIDKNLQLVQEIKKLKQINSQYQTKNKQYQTSVKKLSIIIENLNSQFELKRRQINGLNQKLHQKQSIIKKLKLEADEVYLLKANIRQIEKQRIKENQQLSSLKLQNQKQASIIKQLMSQIQQKSKQLDKISLATSSTLASTINLISRKRFNSSRQIISMKKLNCLSTDIVNQNEFIFQQNQQNFSYKQQQLKENIKRLQQEIKYKDIQILTFKKMKFQAEVYKQMSAKLKKQNQNFKEKLLKLQKYNKKSRNNRILSELQFSLSPQKKLK